MLIVIKHRGMALPLQMNFSDTIPFNVGFAVFVIMVTLIPVFVVVGGPVLLGGGGGVVSFGGGGGAGVAVVNA
jgi:hypothetical protein